MSKLFENIFEKYNISCEVPKKRYRSPKTLTHSCSFYKKPLKLTNSASMCKTAYGNSIPNNTQIIHLNSSCYFNTNTKGKYYSPTRYKTLEIVKAKHYKKYQTQSAEFGICNDDTNGKENFNEHICGILGNHKPFGAIKRDLNINADNAGSELQTNLANASNGGMNRNHLSKNLTAIKADKENLLCEQLSITSVNASKSINVSFEKLTEFKNVSLNESNNFTSNIVHSTENTFGKPSKPKSTPVLTAHPPENSPTELDLLLELIEREERNEKYKQNRTFLKCDDCLPPTKSCRKGGVQEMFERALKQEKANSNFLKYDKKVGLRNGHLLTVVNVVTSYGLTLATVESKDLSEKIGVVVTQEMAPRLKLGTQLEAFFDDKSQPYRLQLNGECLDVYLEPLKLLIV